MNTIKVAEFTKEAASKKRGLELKGLLDDYLKKECEITVDFEGITRFAAPFFSNSFSALALEYGFQAIRSITLSNLSQIGKETFDASLQNAEMIYNNPRYAEKIQGIVNIIPEGTEYEV